MTDEEYRAENQRKAQLRAEREAIVRQQRQEQYDLEVLEYEDPSLYKAVMDKQAAENAAFSAANPVTGSGTLTDGSEVYQSGETRRDLVDYFAPEKGLKRDTIQKFMGGDPSKSGGFGVADLLGAGLLDAADGLSFSRDMNKRNDLAIAQLEAQIIAEGVEPYTLEFYKQRDARMPEMETSFDAMLDIGIGGVEAVTLGMSKFITKPVKGFLRNQAAKFASPVPPVSSIQPKIGALPIADTPSVAMSKQILELRAAGRASEVTDDMMDAADDVYMYANTPLDMSQAALMARGDASYHPTEYIGRSAIKGDLYSAPDIAKSEQSFNTRPRFSSSSPDVASTYVGKRGALYPVRIKKLDTPIIDVGGVDFTDIAPATMDLSPQIKYGMEPFSTIDERLGGIGKKNPNYEESFKNEIKTDDILAALKRNNEGGILIKNLIDRGPFSHGNIKTEEGKKALQELQRKASEPSDVRITMDPVNIRSKFARFDPEFSHLRNLSASILGAVGFTGLAASLKERQSGGGI